MPAPIEVPLPEPPAPQEVPKVIAVSRVPIDDQVTCIVAANQFGEFRLQCLTVAPGATTVTTPLTSTPTAPTAGTAPKQ